jgi:glycosyltransferase involved in cell wall biosynthesis
MPAFAARSDGLRVCMVHCSDFHVDSRIQRQARALAERGDQVDCISLSPAGEMPVGDGVIRLHHVPVGKPEGGARAYLGGYARFFARSLRLVTRLDRQRRFDVVEIHNMPDFLTFAALRPKLRGAALVLNIHDTFPELFSTLFDLPARHPLVRMVRIEERLSASIVDAMLFVTPEARALLASRGVTARRTRVVMNTPDERLFGERRAPVNLPAAGPVRAIYHGGLSGRFGVESLVDAFGLLAARDPDLSLDVYGPNPNAARELATRAARVAPATVRVAPEPTPVQQIPDRLGAAHIGVVPTLRNPFTELLLPVKLLECVHMGLPAVVSRLPVIERYFSDDEVRFFEPGSSESLAGALLDVRRHPEAARERAARASRRLAEIEWPRQRAAYLALIDELAPPHGAASRQRAGSRPASSRGRPGSREEFALDRL